MILSQFNRRLSDDDKKTYARQVIKKCESYSSYSVPCEDYEAADELGRLIVLLSVDGFILTVEVHEVFVRVIASPTMGLPFQPTLLDFVKGSYMTNEVL